MKTCHLFCAADFSGLLEQPGAGDLILAADGGLRHTQSLGITPHAILGDFDSLGYVPQGENILLHPVEKDDTDSMLAVRLGLQEGCGRFLFYGALDGPRLDHTVANFQTLAFLASHGAFGYLVGEQYLVSVLAPGEVSFPDDAEGIISLFALGQAVTGLNIQGLHYPLTNGSLQPDFPLGVSNHFTGAPSRIFWEQGQLLLLWDRKNGLPQYCLKSAPGEG
ncbi:MAG: thiamine diphosphokinase [Ruminococcaceae bacterium]|nr:thiamine diphosphokinase [Oscillospiraceae bacterium]